MQNSRSIFKSKSFDTQEQTPLPQGVAPVMQTETVLDILSIPDNEVQEEWIAFNLFEFIEQITALNAHVQQTCTCAKMDCGKRSYLIDGKQVPAQLYFQQWLVVVTAIHASFPVEDQPYARDFVAQATRICKILARLYTHLFYCHFDQLKEPLSRSFHMFYAFARAQNLIKRDEAELCQEIVSRLQI